MRLNDKEIRFIDSRYNELFRIPDGGKIEITSKDGSKETRTCKYIDNYHFYLGNNCLHICQFAEIMEHNGSTYRPQDVHSYTLEKIEQSEFDFMFAPEDKTENRGCICYIRGYFDNSVDERLQTSAMVENKDNYNKYRTQEFSRECDNVINYFRFQSETPILKSRTKMQNIAYDIGAERYVDDKEISGYRVTTDKNVYYFKCDARRGQYNIYCYAYDKAQLERYKNTRFINKNYDEIDRDKFFKTDSGFTEVYYNPDASAGGQLVYNEISFDLIREAVQNSKTVKDFFTHIDGGCTQYIIDIDTPEFRGNLDSFMRRKADFEGASKKTMHGLMKAVGIKPPNKDMER